MNTEVCFHIKFQWHKNFTHKKKEFSHWFLDKCKDDSFLSHLQMLDEVHFYMNDFVNKQNCRIWVTENPQAVK